MENKITSAMTVGVNLCRIPSREESRRKLERGIDRLLERKNSLSWDCLSEKIPLAGIARAVKVSEAWLQNYVNAKYDAVPRIVKVQSKPKKRLTVQMDELWSFVDDSGNEHSCLVSY